MSNPLKDLNSIDPENIKITPYFKISKKEGKNFQIINLKKQFNFIPDILIIERMLYKHNIIRVIAIKDNKSMFVK